MSSALDFFTKLSAWSAFATALFTALLVVGVAFAGMQFFSQRLSSRVVETGKILDSWRDPKVESNTTDLWLARSALDDDINIDKNRQRANRTYRYIYRRRHRKRFRDIYVKLSDLIEVHSVLAERTEIYLRKGAADESIIMQHLASDIATTYYILQDILQDRASEENLDYDGFRQLAQRAQIYARLHRNLMTRPGLQRARFPVLNYRTNVTSPDYKPGLRRMMLLWIIDEARWRWHLSAFTDSTSEI